MPRPAKVQATLSQRAAYRWAAITAVMATLLVLYTQHPYYKGGQFAPWRPFYTAAFIGWLIFGMAYVRATLTRFSGMRFAMRDGGLHLLLLGKIASDIVPKQPVYAIGIGGAIWGVGQWLLKSNNVAIFGMSTAAIGLVVSLAPLLMHRPTQRRFWRVVKNRRVRTTLLGICVKGFFTPLMTGFVSGHLNSIMDHWLRHKHLPQLHFTIPQGSALAQASAWFTQLGARLGDLTPSTADFSGLFAPSTWTTGDIRWFLDLSYDVVFFVDCAWALAGYASESRWIGNKTRSVEPTAFGWAVCLACYPPYNNILGTYLPLETGPHHAFFATETAQLAFKGLTVFLFAIYASATVAFGFKFSNLTNRGVVMRGPYRVVRHPAYLCKCSAWWLEHIPTMTVTKAFFLTGLCSVYALRAWTEERHLSQDPDYLEYKKKTPWVLLPGIY